MRREETEEERALQKQIDELRVKVEAGEADAPLDPSEGAEGKTVRRPAFFLGRPPAWV